MNTENSFNHYEVSKRLSDVRTILGLTQAQLAESLGISEQAVKNYEKAASQKASSGSLDRTKAIAGMKIETLFNIATKLNISADYLLGLSNVHTVNPQLREAVDYTGLSEDAINLIHPLHLSNETIIHSQILNLFLEEPCFIYVFTNSFYEYCTANHEYLSYRQRMAAKAEQLMDELEKDESADTNGFELELNKIHDLEDNKDIRHLRMQRILNQILDAVEEKYIGSIQTK